MGMKRDNVANQRSNIVMSIELKDEHSHGYRTKKEHSHEYRTKKNIVMNIELKE